MNCNSNSDLNNLDREDSSRRSNKRSNLLYRSITLFNSSKSRYSY